MEGTSQYIATDDKTTGPRVWVEDDGEQINITIKPKKWDSDLFLSALWLFFLMLLGTLSLFSVITSHFPLQYIFISLTVLIFFVGPVVRFLITVFRRQKISASAEGISVSNGYIWWDRKRSFPAEEIEFMSIRPWSSKEYYRGGHIWISHRDKCLAIGAGIDFKTSYKLAKLIRERTWPEGRQEYNPPEKTFWGRLWDLIDTKTRLEKKSDSSLLSVTITKEKNNFDFAFDLIRILFYSLILAGGLYLVIEGSFEEWEVLVLTFLFGVPMILAGVVMIKDAIIDILFTLYGRETITVENGEIREKWELLRSEKNARYEASAIKVMCVQPHSIHGGPIWFKEGEKVQSIGRHFSLLQAFEIADEIAEKAGIPEERRFWFY